MTPDVVADVGNSRVKFGLCDPSTKAHSAPGISRLAALPLDDPNAWTQQLREWNVPRSGWVVIASVNPPVSERLQAWLQDHGWNVQIIADPGQVPLRLDVAEPSKVGIDRLLTALAAHRRAPGRTAVIANLGTAVTVDWITPDGSFLGGAIFPGIATMLRALHDYTALLPDIRLSQPVQTAIGRSTTEAISTGVLAAVVGGIQNLVSRGSSVCGVAKPVFFLTGGDAERLAGYFEQEPQVIPTLTLEGLRIAAEAVL